MLARAATKSVSGVGLSESTALMPCANPNGSNGSRRPRPTSTLRRRGSKRSHAATSVCWVTRVVASSALCGSLRHAASARAEKPKGNVKPAVPNACAPVRPPEYDDWRTLPESTSGSSGIQPTFASSCCGAPPAPNRAVATTAARRQAEGQRQARRAERLRAGSAARGRRLANAPREPERLQRHPADIRLELLRRSSRTESRRGNDRRAPPDLARVQLRHRDRSRARCRVATQLGRAERAGQSPAGAVVALRDEHAQQSVVTILAPAVDAISLAAMTARAQDLERRAEAAIGRHVVGLQPDVAGAEARAGVIERAGTDAVPVAEQRDADAGPRPRRIAGAVVRDVLLAGENPDLGARGR